MAGKLNDERHKEQQMTARTGWSNKRSNSQRPGKSQGRDIHGGTMVGTAARQHPPFLPLSQKDPSRQLRGTNLGGNLQPQYFLEQSRYPLSPRNNEPISLDASLRRSSKNTTNLQSRPLQEEPRYALRPRTKRRYLAREEGLGSSSLGTSDNKNYLQARPSLARGNPNTRARPEGFGFYSSLARTVPGSSSSRGGARNTVRRH
jgi:hypothetical protein